MKPAPFTYHRPRSRDEVDGLLAEHGADAKVLAGGQSLIPILNMRLAAYAHLVDINHLEDEATAPIADADAVRLGPLVRQQAAERSLEVARLAPLLSETLHFVAHPAIRSRGTVVGSVAHADPAAELPAVALLLGAEVTVRSRDGSRTVPAGEFFLGPLESACEQGAWVEEVSFPAATHPRGHAFFEFARRAGDYALCGVAGVAARDAGGRVLVELSYLGMGPVPVRVALPPLEPGQVAGRVLDDAVRQAVAAGLEPDGDLHATAAYRSWLAARLGARCARAATDRLEASELLQEAG